MSKVKKLLPVYLIVFFGYIGYSLIITIFTPMFLQNKGGLLPTDLPDNVRFMALGVIIFLYPFGQFLSAPVLGALSDRWGRRPVFVYSLIISSLVYALIGLAIWMSSLWIVIASLLILGLSEGNVAIAQSAVADISTKKERNRLFGYVTVSASASYVVGPLLGGWLADLPINSTLSFATPFFVVAVLFMVTLSWIYFGFKESLSERKREHLPYIEAFTNLKNLFLMRRVRYIFLVNFFLYLAMYGYFQSFPIYIVYRFHINVGLLSLFIAWSSIPFMIVNLGLTSYLAKKFKTVDMILVSGFCIGLFLMILLIPANLHALWITLFLVGAAAAVCLPITSALLSSLAEAREQGRVLGINQSLQMFAEAFSGLAAGFLAAIFIKLALIIFGVLSFVGAFLLLAKRKEFSLH